MFTGFEGVKGGVYGVPVGQGGSMGVKGEVFEVQGVKGGVLGLPWLYGNV